MLPDIAVYALQQLDNYKIRTPDGHITHNAAALNVRRTLNAMLVRAGCEAQSCSLHALRHTYGAILLVNGVDIKTISKLLGHKSIEVTCDIYLDLIKELEIKAVDCLNNFGNGIAFSEASE